MLLGLVFFFFLEPDLHRIVTQRKDRKYLIGCSKNKLAFSQQMYLKTLLYLQFGMDEIILCILYVCVYKKCLYVYNQRPEEIETDP